MKSSKGQLNGFLITHVDHFLYGGNKQFLDSTAKFKQRVKIGSEGMLNFNFCGINLKTMRNGEIVITVAGGKSNFITPVSWEEEAEMEQLTANPS